MITANKIKKLPPQLRDYFEEYCSYSTIHGLRYFGEKRSLCERVLWILMVLFSLIVCVFISCIVYAKFKESPVIVTFATKETPIYAIPFPAVTLCPETKSVGDFSYTKLFEKVTLGQTSHTDIEYFEALAMLCDKTYKYATYEHASHKIENIFEIFHKLKPHFMDQTFNCRFLGQDHSCSDLFSPIITDEGVCYSFNILHRDDIFESKVEQFRDYHTGHNRSLWTIEDGYKNSKEFRTYPERALLSGVNNGLTINMIALKNNSDFKCKGVQGYKVALHNPMRVPQLKLEYIRIPLNEKILAAVKPKMITTAQGVKQFNLNKRDCVFTKERKLYYFKSYTQFNCQLECLTNFTLGECGCVNMFMPREKQTEICRYSKLKCMEKAEVMMRMQEIKARFKSVSSVSCNCMPICTDLSYSVESSKTKWHWEQFVPLNETAKKLVHVSSLTVYMKVNHFIKSERNELYGTTHFIANFGGLFSLFTGVSLLSVIEIFYFLTLRIFCNVRRYGHWVGREQGELV